VAVTVLLDTHVLLWALMEPHRLSRKARRILEDIDNTLLVSSACAWEIATKHRLGRLPEAATVVRGYKTHLSTLRATELPIIAEHALLAGTLLQRHRDPFDRILAAQAMVEGVPLVTRDSAFKPFQVQAIW
jgi:PIN domain nuclease of toxin-antitoxin system